MSKPTPEQLERSANEYVHYELVTLLHARRIHDRASEKQKQSFSQDERDSLNATQCCALEAFLLHYRNLKEFLCNKGGGDDDLKAAFYAPQWSATWDSDAGENKRLNKLLAHISFKRTEYGPGSWNLDEMENRVCRVVEEFLVAAANPSLFARVRAALDERARPKAMLLGAASATTTTVTTFNWWRVES
jgi:hypothetical protein